MNCFLASDAIFQGPMVAGSCLVQGRGSLR